MVDSVDISDQKLAGLLRELQSNDGWATFRPDYSVTDWRFVKITNNVTIEQTTDLIIAFPELSFTFATKINVNSHAMAAAVRQAAYHAVMHRLESVHNKFVDIGGNPMLFLTKSTEVHCCCPILSDHDQHRWNTRKTFANKMIKDNNSLLTNCHVKTRLEQISAIDIYAPEAQTFPFVCTNRGQACSVAADTLISVDSIYDIPVSDALECLIHHNATTLHVAYISPDALLKGATETFVPELGVTILLENPAGESGRLISFNTADENPPHSFVERISKFFQNPSVASEPIHLNNISQDTMSHERIRYVFMDGNEYVHNASLLLWSMLPRAFKFVSREHHIYNIHVEHEGVRMGYTFLSVSKYPATTPVPRNRGAILPALDDYQIIINWPVVVEGTYVIRAQHILVPKPIYQSLKTHCTKMFERNTTQEKADKIASMKNFLTSLNTRTIVNGKNVSSHKNFNHGYDTQICYAVLDIVVKENKNTLIMLDHPQTKKISWVENLLRAITNDQLPPNVIDGTCGTSYMLFFKSPSVMQTNVRLIPPSTSISLQFSDRRLDAFSRLIGRVVLPYADEAEIDKRIETLTDFYSGANDDGRNRECDILIDVVDRKPAILLSELLHKFPDLDLASFGIKTVNKASKNCTTVKNIEEFEKAYLAKKLIPTVVPNDVSQLDHISDTDSYASDTETLSSTSSSDIPATSAPEVNVSMDGLTKFNGHLVVGICEDDIFNRRCEAIVNPANGRMSHGGGLARVIMDRAGVAIEQETIKFVKNEQLSVSDNIITAAGRLANFSHIIHAVGPNAADVTCLVEQTKLLTHTITNIFDTCNKNDIRSVCIPFISAGIFAVDINICANAYLHACFNCPTSGSLERVEFVTNNNHDYKCVKKYFTEVTKQLQPSIETFSQFNLVDDGVMAPIPPLKKFGDFESYVLREDDARSDSFLASLIHFRHAGDENTPPLSQVAVRLQDPSTTPWSESEINAVNEFMTITVYEYNAALRFISVCANNVPKNISKKQCDPNHHQGYWDKVEIIRSDAEVTHAFFEGKVRKIHTLPDESLVFVSIPYATFYAALRLESIISLDFKGTQTVEKKFISGVPGCGKTHTLIQLFHSGCVGVTATRNTRDQINNADIAGSPSSSSKAYTVDGALVFAARNKTGKIRGKTVGLFDEAPMNHYGGLLLVMSALKLRRALLVGDKKQIGYINRGGLHPNYAHLPMLPSHHQVVSHRITPHTAAIIHREYPDGILTTNTRTTLCEVRALNGIADVTNVAIENETTNGGILTFTQGHKLQLQKNRERIPSSYHIMTVHEAQGQTFQNVILVRLSAEKLAILDIARGESITPHMLVGITRHTKKFVYLTADLTDGLVKIINATQFDKKFIVDEQGVRNLSDKILNETKIFVGNTGGGAVPTLYIREQPSARVRKHLDQKLFDYRIVTKRTDKCRVALVDLARRLRHTSERIKFSHDQFNKYATIVSNDAKGRFYIIRRGDNFEIVAAQGHTVVKPDVILTPVSEHITICHVTNKNNVASISTTGLSRRDRKFIHAIEGDRANAMKSHLARKGNAFVEIAVDALRSEGIGVYQSINGVILIDADFVPVRLLNIFVDGKLSSPQKQTKPPVPSSSHMIVTPPTLQLFAPTNTTASDNRKNLSIKKKVTTPPPQSQPAQITSQQDVRAQNHFAVSQGYYIVDMDVNLYKTVTTFVKDVVDRSKVFRTGDRLLSVKGRKFSVVEFAKFQNRDEKIEITIERPCISTFSFDRYHFDAGLVVYALDADSASVVTDYKTRSPGSHKIDTKPNGDIVVHIGVDDDTLEKAREGIESIIGSFIDGGITQRQSMVVICSQSLADDVVVNPDVYHEELSVYIVTAKPTKSVQFAPILPSPSIPQPTNMCWYHAVHQYMHVVFHVVIDRSDADAFLERYDLKLGEMQDAVEFLQFCLSDIYGLLLTDVSVDELKNTDKPALVYTPDHWSFEYRGVKKCDTAYFVTRTMFTVLHRLVKVHDYLRKFWRKFPRQYGKNLPKLLSLIDGTGIETVIELTPAPGNTIKQLRNLGGVPPFRYYTVEHRQKHLTAMNGATADVVCHGDLVQCRCIERYTWCNTCKSRQCECGNNEKYMLFLDIARVDSDNASNQFEFNEELFRSVVEKCSTTNFHVTIKTFCHPRILNAMFTGMRPWIVFRSHESSPYGSEIYLTTLDIPACSPSQILRDTITNMLPHLPTKRLQSTLYIEGCVGNKNVPDAMWAKTVKFRDVTYKSVFDAWDRLLFLAPMHFQTEYMNDELRVGPKTADFLNSSLTESYDEQFVIFFREIESQLVASSGEHQDTGIFPHVSAGVVSSLLNSPTKVKSLTTPDCKDKAMTTIPTPVVDITTKATPLQPRAVTKFRKPNLLDVALERVTEQDVVDPIFYACIFAKWVTVFSECNLPLGDLSLIAYVHGRRFSDHVYCYLTSKIHSTKLAQYQLKFSHVKPDVKNFDYRFHDCDGICLADAAASKKFFNYNIHPLRPKKACMRFMRTTPACRKTLGVEMRNVGGALNDIYKPSTYSTSPYPFDGVAYVVEHLPESYPLPESKENLIDAILTGNADIITERDLTRTHFVYPEVRTGELEEDYQRSDVQGCLAVMQSYVDEMTPGNSIVDTTYDNVMIELSDIPIEASEVKFSHSRINSAPKFTEKPSAKLHSGVQCNFPATPKGVIIGFNKRNANPPRLESAFSPDDRALMIWDALVEFIMVDNAREVLQIYQRNPIGITPDGLRFWMARFDTNLKLHRLDAFTESDKFSKTGSVFDIPMDLFNVTIKTKAKTVISTASQVQIAKPQMIMASVPYVTAVLSNVFQAIMVRFEGLLPPSVALPWSRNSMNLSASLNYLMNSLGLAPQHLTEIDISAFDKSQLEVAHRFKMLAYRKLGLHPDILHAWDECHKRTTNLHEPSGTTFKTWYQQKSGDATTLLGNTLFNLATLAFVFRQRFPIIAAVGDDSLLYTPKHVDSKIVEASYVDMCNLEAKVVDKSRSAYFCGHFLVRDTITQDYVLVKDPAKVLYKCGLDSQESLEQLIDRFKSLGDETKFWKTKSLLPGLNEAFKDRYGISRDIYPLVDALLNIANDFEKFSSLWDYPKTWVPEDKRRLLKRFSRDKHPYVEIFYKNLRGTA